MMFSSNITSTGSNNENALPSGVGGESIKTHTNTGLDIEQDSNDHVVGPPVLVGLQVDDARDRNLHTKKHRR